MTTLGESGQVARPVKGIEAAGRWEGDGVGALGLLPISMRHQLGGMQAIMSCKEYHGTH